MRDLLRSLPTTLDRIELAYNLDRLASLKHQLSHVLSVGQHKAFVAAINAGVEAMRETTVKVDGREVCLWDLDGVQLMKDDQGSRRRQLELNGNTEAVVNALGTIEGFIGQYEEASGWTRLKRRVTLWLSSEKPLGSSSYMRAELEMKYNGEQFWVPSGNKRIDCMLLKSRTGQDAATILFCNPNACFYEYLAYQTEWVDYYHAMGVNLVIWNYRGYGRSDGGLRISPSGIMQDGERVFHYLRSSLP